MVIKLKKFLSTLANIVGIIILAVIVTVAKIVIETVYNYYFN